MYWLLEKEVTDNKKLVLISMELSAIWERKKKQFIDSIKLHCTFYNCKYQICGHNELAICTNVIGICINKYRHYFYYDLNFNKGTAICLLIFHLQIYIHFQLAYLSKCDWMQQNRPVSTMWSQSFNLYPSNQNSLFVSLYYCPTNRMKENQHGNKMSHLLRWLLGCGVSWNCSV